MSGNILTFVLTLATVSASASLDCAPGEDGQSQACSEPMPMQGEAALLQVQKLARSHKVHVHGHRLEPESHVRTKVNPSGAAAPLNDEGYFAVADRCCQAEMRQFIDRAAEDLGYEECSKGGLGGMVPYHSCEMGPKNFANLTKDILDASGGECSWLGLIGTCQPRPVTCENFTGPANFGDCGCSRSKAAKLDFSASTITENNLGGRGPSTGAAEIRYSNIGTSESGAPFDLVVTTWTPQEHVGPPYVPANSANNGMNNGMGVINIAPIGQESYTGTTDFKFSFMEPGTNVPVVLSEVHMAIVDLDKEGYTGCVEIASSKGYKGYVTDTDPSVVASLGTDGRTKFVAMNAGLKNPTSPTALTNEQRRNAVMYFYSEVSSFELTFGTEDFTCSAGRNLFFAFESSLNDRCAP